MKAFLLVLVACGACTGNINDANDLGDDAAAAGDDASPSVFDAAPAVSPDAAPVNAAVARGEAWVVAQVPYCQAINHAPDGDTDCSATCTRPDNAAWDPYRSDCSGFVSWAWGLPSTDGGRATGGFAPFQTDISHVIAAADLQPGDAVNRTAPGHMMLFKEWITPGVVATFMEEPGCSSDTPYAHEFSTMVMFAGDLLVVSGYGTYTAIRQN